MDFYVAVHIVLHTGSDVCAAGRDEAYIRLVCVLRQPGVNVTPKPAAPRLCRREGINLNPRPHGFAGLSVKSITMLAFPSRMS